MSTKPMIVIAHYESLRREPAGSAVAIIFSLKKNIAALRVMPKREMN